MQRFATIALTAAALTITSFAHAAGQLAPVTVHRNFISAACAPPSYAQECASFHAAIRRNFSTREIGMLFGAATSYPEYPTSFERVRAKYAAFASNAEENGVALVVAVR
jgi:hypothetical protein